MPIAETKAKMAAVGLRDAVVVRESKDGALCYYRYFGIQASGQWFSAVSRIRSGAGWIA
jgi:hypothetical protein